MAWHFDRRNSIMMTGSLISLIGYVMFLASTNEQTSIRYSATFFGAAGSFLFGALCNAQVSANVLSDTACSSVSCVLKSCHMEGHR
jgi:hypothetical protein